MSKRNLIFLLFALGAVFLGVPKAYRPAAKGVQGVWTTSGFLGFIDGTLTDGGANTYVAADGTVRLINLWDLNHDGNVDIVLPSTHDNNEKLPLFIYWNKGGFTRSRRTELPTDGAKALAVQDLNHDGYPDLVVANNFNGTKTELDSYIYWGSSNGFDAGRRSDLPTQGAEAVAIADLNGDGYPDLVFANNGVTYHTSEDHRNQSYVYWGSKEGYSPDHRSVLKTIHARNVKIADLNSDGIPDIVFADEGNISGEGGALIYWGSVSGRYSEEHSTFLPGEMTSALAISDLNGDGYPEIVLANSGRLKERVLEIYNIFDTLAVNSYVYWGSPQGYSVAHRTELPTVGASCVVAGDLNGDGKPDIVFGNSAGGAAYIYWSDGSEFQTNRRTAIPTQNVSDCAISDLNHDGHPDLIFATNDDGRTHNVPSSIYWGGTDGFNPSRRTDLPTFGATGLAIADLDRDGEKDLVFINKQDGTAGGPSNSYIYWGDEHGQFSVDRRQALPTLSANSYSAADINNDGYVDLFLPETGKQTIYWGGAQGFSSVNKTVVAETVSFSGRIADFNRDGYLDILVSQWSPAGDEIRLYYGGPGGFSAANCFVFQVKNVRFPAVADLNKDNWPDIVVPTTTGQTFIFWNGPKGFDNSHRTTLTGAATVHVNVADLNGDGYLDVILGNLYDPKPPETGPHTFGGSPEGNTYIYWGSAEGYSQTNLLILPSVGTHDVSVADLNGDGLLDLVLSSYHAGTTRNHPSYIYWNGPNGFNPQRVTMLPTNSAAGVLVADFDQDGYKDILFACHSNDGNHRTESFLYWGGPAGYSVERRSLIPGEGVHMFNSVDIGDVYNRGDRYDYVSVPFDGGPGVRFESINWQGDSPFRTRIEFQIRCAPTREGLNSAPWTGPKGSGSYYAKQGENLASQPANARWLQYKASLVSPNSADTPVLRSVSVGYAQANLSN